MVCKKSRGNFVGRKSLSVAMANYNHEHYIGEALEAILAQSFKPSEVIIVDDGSTDSSIQVIKEFVDRDRIVCLLLNEQNMGAVLAQKIAISNASSDYLYGAAADDKVLPEFFEKSMDLLSMYPQAGLCCSDPVTFVSSSGRVTENKLRLSNTPCYFSPEETESIITKKNPWIACHASILKKAAFEEAGGLIPSLFWHCDWFALLVTSFRYGICYVPESLASLRVLDTSYSSSGAKNWLSQSKVLCNMLDILKSPNYLDILPKFRNSAVLSCFGMPLLKVVLNNPKHKDFLTPLLLKRILWNETKRIISPITPRFVKDVYRDLRGR